MARALPAIEQLHEESVESKVQLRVVRQHITEASDGLAELLAQYQTEDENAE